MSYHKYGFVIETNLHFNNVIYIIIHNYLEIS